MQSLFKGFHSFGKASECKFLLLFFYLQDNNIFYKANPHFIPVFCFFIL